MKKKYLRTQEISKIIEKEYNNVWFPNKSKKLRLRYTIENLDLYKYYQAEEVIIYIRLIAKNSVGLNYNKIILEKEITEVWNNTFYYKKPALIDEVEIKEIFGLEINLNGWEILKDSFYKEEETGVLLMKKNNELFSIIYKTNNTFTSLNDYSNYMNEKFVYNLKHQNTILKPLVKKEAIINDIDVNIEEFSATFNDEDSYILKVVNFKLENYFFTFSYPKNPANEKYFNEIILTSKHN